MYETEPKTVREDIAEIKVTVKDISAVVDDMRVLLASDYLTKQNFEEFKKETEGNRRWWSGFVIASTGVFAAIINSLWN